MATVTPFPATDRRRTLSGSNARRGRSRRWAGRNGLAALAESERQRLAAHARREKRRRIDWIAAIWVVFVMPGLVMAWAFTGWIGVAVGAFVIGWTTWDYYRRGGMVDALEGGLREGEFLAGAFDENDPCY